VDLYSNKIKVLEVTFSTQDQ